MTEVRIGIISDTHGLLRDEVKQVLKECQLIIHAGDIGSIEILNQLQSIAKVEAVRGNVDISNEFKDIAYKRLLVCEGLKIFVVHNISQLNIDPKKEKIDIVVYGHSHKSDLKDMDGVKYINPGSAGPRRFSLPISCAILKKNEEKVDIEFIEI